MSYVLVIHKSSHLPHQICKQMIHVLCPWSICSKIVFSHMKKWFKCYLVCNVYSNLSIVFVDVINVL